MDKHWILHRLRAMSIGEMYYRFGKIVRFKLIKFKLKQKTVKFPLYLSNKKVDAATKKNIEIISEIDLRLDLEISENLDELDFDTNELIKQANEVLLGKVKVFGKELALSDKYDWVTDPLSSIRWPRRFFLDIDYRRENCPGDPKLIWELNRQQWLVTMGVAYRITGDEKYANNIITSIISWIENNPEYIGINWVSSLEQALRIITWTFALNLIKNSSGLNELNRIRIAQSVYEQADFIFKYLSLYSSSNNHLIGELTGLLYSSFILKESERTKKWRASSMKMLEKEAGRQFHRDGVNCEQSIYYQCYTMEYYFLCEYIQRIHGGGFHENIINILKKSCRFVEDISDKAGLYPNIGDEDGGYSLRIMEKENKALSILSFGAMLFNEDYLNFKQNYFDLKSYLLFDRKYIAFYKKGRHQYDKERRMKLYPEGGYCIFKASDIKAKETLIIFDFGPIGMKPLSAHGHADLLSVNIIFNNIPFIVDAGTYKYYFSDGWRSYFKSTAAHNTISVNNESMLPSLGNFLWGKHPKVEYKYDVTSGTYVEAEHDGYLKSYGVTHRRRLEYRENILYIMDFIKSSNNNFIQQFYHLNPDSKVVYEKDRLYRITIRDQSMLMEMDKGLESTLIKGETNPIKSGWNSSSFYDLKEATTIISSTYITGEKCFLTKIIFGDT